MAILDVSCLQSQVMNISGQTMFFHFLGRHGTKLASGGVYQCYGDIFNDVCNGFKGARGIRPLLLLDAIQKGLLLLTYTPSPVLWDKGHQEVSMLKINNGAVTVQEACWNKGSAGAAVSIP